VFQADVAAGGVSFQLFPPTGFIAGWTAIVRPSRRPLL
jgi:hypothetical protein